MIEQAAHRLEYPDNPLIELLLRIGLRRKLLQILLIGNLEQKPHKNLIRPNQILRKSHNLIILQNHIDPSPYNLTWKGIVRFRDLIVMVMQLVDDVSGVDAAEGY